MTRLLAHMRNALTSIPYCWPHKTGCPSWQRVAARAGTTLADGDAAQALVLGIPAAGIPTSEQNQPASGKIEAPDPNQQDLL